MTGRAKATKVKQSGVERVALLDKQPGRRIFAAGELEVREGQRRGAPEITVECIQSHSEQLGSREVLQLADALDGWLRDRGLR